MAATEKKQMWFHASDDGVAPVKLTNQLIAATQGIYMPGSIAYRSTSGTWKRVATSASPTTDSYSGFLLDAPTVAHAANDSVQVALIAAKNVYAIFAESGGSDSAVAQANVGNKYGLTVSATAGQVGYTTLKLDDTTNFAVMVVDLMCNVEPSKFAIADSPGIALVRFLDGVINVAKA